MTVKCEPNFSITVFISSFTFKNKGVFSGPETKKQNKQTNKQNKKKNTIDKL